MPLGVIFWDAKEWQKYGKVIQIQPMYYFDLKAIAISSSPEEQKHQRSSLKHLFQGIKAFISS